MAEQPPAYEELAHTADLRLRVHGASLAELFAHAAQGMFALRHCRPAPQTARVVQALQIESYDTTALLVDWLTELLYLSERDGAAYDQFEIAYLDATHLTARIAGFQPAQAARQIKAVTFSDLDIVRLDSGSYRATITFDV